MDEEDIFRKLGTSLKFNVKRFKNDAQKLNISTPSTIKKLDFFDNLTSGQSPKTGKQVKRSKREKTTHCEEPTRNDETNHQGKSDNGVHSVRKKYRIQVDGSDIPEPITTFQHLHSEYDFNMKCMENISKKGFKELTPIQMQAIPSMMHGREILACAPTGSGKTLAFLVPIISHILKQAKQKKKGKHFCSLILSPTHELAEQTLRECKELVSVKESETPESTSDLIRVKFLDKGETKRYMRRGMKQATSTDLLISTPNRIVYLLQQDPPMISLEFVEWLVVDESDKLFEEGQAGKSFREQLGTIYASCTNPKIRRAMFSATFAYDVQQWCLLNMDNVLQITVGGKNTAVRSVNQKLQYVGNEHGKLLALQQIIRGGFSPPVIIFVQSKERAKELFAEMIYDGVNIDAIHADRTPMQRENAVKSFRRGDTWILICTELMGRGIDFKGVNLVINYDFPTSAVSYIHRIGRTGRAGRRGEAVTFFTDEDRPLLRSVSNLVRAAGCEVPEYMLRIKKPQKDERKRLARKERQRSSIRTAPPDVLQSKKRKNLSKEDKPQTKRSKSKVTNKQQ
uniref:Probable ATP-dependent RNA helicase DDX52 n=1 Tax=Phallusia mammillata TaxID=59560 RepID=A0A6F9DA70_9ASCI|nr:probable ATP-dependent RNA helicase DDX52 [Phallusia mammillata]